MLWLADAVAGAVSASAGGKAEYVEALGVRLALSDIVP
jgi:hypothetical protein